MNTRREELALRIQNGDLTTRHDMGKCRESFGPLLTPLFFFFMIGDDPSQSKVIRPGLAVRSRVDRTSARAEIFAPRAESLSM